MRGQDESKRLRAILALLPLSALVGCGGPYKITYTMPSKEAPDPVIVTEEHRHGIGPLIVGGGGFFTLFQAISPALVDYTGSVETSKHCPNGFSQVEHHHTSDQNSDAALLSWLLIVNWRHASTVEWTCAP